MAISNYEKVIKLREALLEEMKAQIPILTVEHLALIEMRVQTAIMAGLDDEDVDNEVNKK